MVFCRDRAKESVGALERAKTPAAPATQENVRGEQATAIRHEIG